MPLLRRSAARVDANSGAERQAMSAREVARSAATQTWPGQSPGRRKVRDPAHLRQSALRFGVAPALAQPGSSNF